MKNCNKLQILGVILLLIFSSCFIYAEEKFEKGDAIYTDMGGGLNPFWFLGHAGLYYYWDSTENEVSHVAEPENYEKHFIIQSADNGVQGFGKNKITFQKFYDDGKFWGVKTTKLSYLQRKKIIQIANQKRVIRMPFSRAIRAVLRRIA
ncbi:MAG: hypothetical protein Q7J67_03480 [bacterium]|nr:hypothetical protein [bacterium]